MAEPSANGGTAWDIICVGAGISSLTYAAAAMQFNPGLRALVIDKHTVAGGYASEFMRPKFGARFDCSLHKLSGMGEQGNLRRLFRELDLESELGLRFSRSLCEVSLLGGDGPATALLLSADPDLARESLIERYPEDAAGLRQFFGEVALYGYNVYMQFQALTGDFEPDIPALRYANKHLKRLSVSDALRQRLHSPELREILALVAVYVGTFPEQVNYLYFLHVVYACHFMGCAYVVGGSQRLSDVLVARIRKGGGEVRLKTRVERIDVDPATQQVVGVTTNRGSFATGHVAINAAPQHALAQFFDATAALASSRDAIGKLRPANATTTLYLVFDEAPELLGLSDPETMLLGSDPERATALREAARAEPVAEASCEDAYWHSSTIEVTNYHALDPSGGKVVVVNALDSIAHWPSRKTPGYKEKKARAATALLERLFEHKPGLRGHVLFSEISSPHTYVFYTNNTAGSGYGALVEPAGAGHGFQYRFPIGGVTFMSAWVAGSGYEAGMGYGALKARSLRSKLARGRDVSPRPVMHRADPSIRTLNEQPLQGAPA